MGACIMKKTQSISKQFLKIAGTITVYNVFHAFNVYYRGLIVCIKQQHPQTDKSTPGNTAQMWPWSKAAYSNYTSLTLTFVQLVLDLSSGVPCILYKQKKKKKNPYYIVTLLSLKLTYLQWWQFKEMSVLVSHAEPGFTYFFLSFNVMITYIFYLSW